MKPVLSVGLLTVTYTAPVTTLNTSVNSTKLTPWDTGEISFSVQGSCLRYDSAQSRGRRQEAGGRGEI